MQSSRKPPPSVNGGYLHPSQYAPVGYAPSPSPTPSDYAMTGGYPASAQSHVGSALSSAHSYGQPDPVRLPVLQQYAPPPRYEPVYDQRPPQWTASPPPPAAPASFFEAALARARGHEPVPHVSREPAIGPPPQSFAQQPMPSYLPPQDPNHPDLAVGFTQSSTVRFAMANDRSVRRDQSRSPSPERGDYDYDYNAFNEKSYDMEKALLEDDDGAFDRPHLREIKERYSTDERLDHQDMGVSPAWEGGADLGQSTTQHFGPAPTGRVGRRTHNAAGLRRIKQKATLDEHGFFVVDMPIPTRLAQFLPIKGVEEQKTTRYTAVTTDPDGFAASGFRLRQNNFSPPRQTELFIVVTMYNEDAQLFCRTLYGVMKNISHLCGRKNSRVWGKDGWQKVVVCIVADGRKNCNPRVLDCLAALGVYQEGAMTNSVKGRPVTAHVFEYTTSFALDSNLHFKYPDKGIVPCQIIFCMKEKNAKKINSHRWFFNAFAPLLSPNVCILLDVGTMPAPKSLYHLWKAFDLNSNVGGACGEIATFKGKTWRGLLNPLVAAQCFEYKMSNILDKPMESLFGYCAVLPGAFSAYRNDASGKGPLASYFQGENLHTGKADTFTANMYYLAEDRILCFEIVAKPKANWVLKYVKSAVGETDCPDTIPEFIGQRRRWLNGSFFAAVYALGHFVQLWRTDHSFLRKMALMLEFFYNALNLVFSWFSLCNFYCFFVILTSALESDTFDIPHIVILNKVLQYGYLGAVIACFIFAMGNRPQGSPLKYKLTIYFFALLTTYMLVCAVLCMIQAIKNIDSPVFARMIVSMLSTYGAFVASSLLALDPWHIVTCFVQFILFSPTYINVLNIYAFSNLHDLSWGTKGSDTTQAADLGAIQGVGKDVEVALVSEQVDIDSAYQDALDNIRLKRDKVDDSELPPKKEAGEQKQKDTYLLLLWSLSNALLASVILSGSDTADTFSGTGDSRTGIYMLVILVFVAGMAGFRFICSTLYLIVRLFGG